MRRFIVFLCLMALYGAVKFNGRIWWQKPWFEVKPVVQEEALVFKTPFSHCKAFLTAKGIFIYREGQLFILSPSFEKIAPTAELIPSGEREKEPLFLAVFSGGTGFVAGYKNKTEGGLLLEIWELSSQWRKNEVVIEDSYLKEKFSRCRKAAHFVANWKRDRLFFWVGCGREGGSLFAVHPYSSRKVETVKEGVLPVGFGEEFMAFASPFKKGVWIRGPQGSFAVEDAGHDALLSSRWLLYRKGAESTTWYLYDLHKRKVMASFRLESARVRPLHLTASGKRVFFAGEFRGRKHLFLYDLRKKRAFAILALNQGEIEDLQSCYDGEFFLFNYKGRLWAGYLPDDEPPVIKIKIFPLFKGKAFTRRVKLQIKVKDRCFVSGALGWVEVNGKRYPSTSFVELSLKPGRNLLRIKAGDRAGNTAERVEELYFEKPLHVSLKQIGENPSLYYGKVVVIEGIAWGFMAARPPEAEGLPFAKGCEAKTRSWGSIEDGTAVALYPVPPAFSGRIRVYALIKPYRRGWIIEPLFEERISGRK